MGMREIRLVYYVDNKDDLQISPLEFLLACEQFALTIFTIKAKVLMVSKKLLSC